LAAILPAALAGGAGDLDQREGLDHAQRLHLSRFQGCIDSGRLVRQPCRVAALWHNVANGRKP
jgi:hypothetical protein